MGLGGYTLTYVRHPSVPSFNDKIQEARDLENQTKKSKRECTTAYEAERKERAKKADATFNHLCSVGSVHADAVRAEADESKATKKAEYQQKVKAYDDDIGKYVATQAKLKEQKQAQLKVGVEQVMIANSTISAQREEDAKAQDAKDIAQDAKDNAELQKISERKEKRREQAEKRQRASQQSKKMEEEGKANFKRRFESDDATDGGGKRARNE